MLNPFVTLSVTLIIVVIAVSITIFSSSLNILLVFYDKERERYVLRILKQSEDYSHSMTRSYMISSF